jgi:hypothetical protein
MHALGKTVQIRVFPRLRRPGAMGRTLRSPREITGGERIERGVSLVMAGS